MFLVLLTYTAPLEEIDRHLPAHRAFLARHYAAGTLLISGRQEPRTGGVILAKAASRDELAAVLAEDPFHIHDLADYQIVQFTPTMSAPAFETFVTV